MDLRLETPPPKGVQKRFRWLVVVVGFVFCSFVAPIIQIGGLLFVVFLCVEICCEAIGATQCEY